MTIKDIVRVLDAKIITSSNLDTEIRSACGSDMMSDVLAYVKDQSALITGLINPQVIRTADMMDMKCIIFVRGKEPDETVVQLAREKMITLLSTRFRMFTACGLLYMHGLRGGCGV